MATQDQAMPGTCEGTRKDSKGQRPNRAETQDKALAHARLAREAIGEDALQKIAAALVKQQRSATARAKAHIEKADPLRVTEEIRLLIREI